jgi:DNA polymerase-1
LDHFDVLGQPLNIKSPLQMKDLFYRVLAQKEVLSRKTRSPTCDDAALERISSREPLLLPLCNVIRELRSLGVFRSTFLEAPVDYDERMRCSFNIAGTETYRFSSSENAFGSGMNLQNIPSGDEAEGFPNIRKLFITDDTPEQMEFFDIDLDSADLRIVVWEADCLEMKQMFAEGLKPYVEVAKEYYRDPSIDKHHQSYKLFKALCHGTNYLGTASGLSGRIGLVTNEVERIQKWYFGKFPEIKSWQERIINAVNTQHYVENVFGYREYIFDRIEGTIYNQAVAWVPQSTVGCLINRGYRNIHQSEPDIQVLLQVHDSLAGQYPASAGERHRRAIIDHCSVPLPYPSGELIIPVGIKTSLVSWGDCA